MSAQHTAGPWRIVSDREGELKVKGAGDEWIADCADGFWSDVDGGWIMSAESLPNAALIAAAPDLLAALQGMIDYLPAEIPAGGLRAATRFARAVIAKAVQS